MAEAGGDCGRRSGVRRGCGWRKAAGAREVFHAKNLSCRQFATLALRGTIVSRSITTFKMRNLLGKFASLGALLFCVIGPATAAITDYPFRLMTRADGADQ